MVSKDSAETTMAAMNEAIAAAAPSGTRAWRPGEFEGLFLEHFARVAAVARRLSADGVQAEELAIEAFWRLYRACPRDRSRPAGWLFRAVIRLGLDAARARRRRLRYEAQAAVMMTAGAAGTTPLAQAMAAQQAAQVRAVLARLGRRAAALLILRHTGASYAEIAAATGVKAASVGALLARAEAAFEREYKRRYKTG